MPDIKLISKDTDLSTVHMHYVNWDVEIRGIPYKVYDLEGYVHTIGGRWGNNSYWACPRNADPTTANLIPFSGSACSWSIRLDEANCLHHSGLNGTSIERTMDVQILRNGQLFYSVGARDMDYAYAKAYSLLVELQEGVVNYNCYDYIRKEILGRHIWWKGNPYTLGWYCDGQCAAIAYPGHITLSECNKLLHSMDENSSVKLDLLMDKHISWFNPEY